MSRRTEVEDALYTLLSGKFPGVHWNRLVTGAARTNRVEGTIGCERISYEWLDKLTKAATATFSIYIVDVSGGMAVDSVADEIVAFLGGNRTLGGHVVDSLVQEVVYGAPQGRPDIGAALIRFVVTYDC